MAKTKKEDLKGCCANAARKHGLSEDNLTAGFEFLALEALAQSSDYSDSVLDGEDPTEVRFDRWHTGGPNDGGIDGILFDEERNQIAIIQTKYKAGRADASTDKEARDFFSRLDEWCDRVVREKYNAQTRELLDDAQLDPRKQSIDLYFITSQTASESGAHNYIAESETSNYQDAGKQVNCHYLTVADFVALLDNNANIRTGQIVKEAVIDLPENMFFIFKENTYRVLVATIKGRSISDLYWRRDVRTKLFNANVRSALSTTKINTKIQETAKDPEESGNFFYYNNGITATCSSMTVEGNKVALQNLQVVNGAQTVYSLARALGKSENSGVYVLVRIIETGDAYRTKNKVADQITKFQNTQNPVKVSDFFSNEPFNLWIAKKFDEESGKGRFPQIWYEYKRGYHGKSNAGRKKMTMENLAYLRYAAYIDAPFTYKTQKDIWNGEDQNHNFWLAFGVGGKGEQVSLWPDEDWYETAWLITVWTNLRKRHSELNANQRKKPKEDEIRPDESQAEVHPESKYLGVLARYITALAFHLMRNRRSAGDFSTFKECLYKDNSDVLKIEKTVIKTVRKAVRYELVDNPKWKSVANPRLNMPQDSETWIKLKAKVVHDYSSEIDDEYAY